MKQQPTSHRNMYVWKKKKVCSDCIWDAYSHQAVMGSKYHLKPLTELIIITKYGQQRQRQETKTKDRLAEQHIQTRQRYHKRNTHTNNRLADKYRYHERDTNTYTCKYIYKQATSKALCGPSTIFRSTYSTFDANSFKQKLLTRPLMSEKKEKGEKKGRERKQSIQLN
jgi:hypothetical protein